jgi:hypothetical protein
MSVFLKRNDVGEVISYTCKNMDGSVVNLTGATVRFLMGKKNKLIVADVATVVDAASGKVSYTLKPEDTVVAGNFPAEFEVTWTDTGNIKTYPSLGYLIVNMEANIDSSQSTVVEERIVYQVGQVEAYKTATDATLADHTSRINALEVSDGGSGNGQTLVVHLADFNGADDEIKIQAAIDFAVANSIKTVLLEDVAYTVSTPIVIKPNIKLMGGKGSSFMVYGANYNAVEIQKNASLEGLTINVDDINFIGNVLYLDGKHKYYNSWNRSAIKDVAIIDWNDFHLCTGIKLFADGNGDEISFLDFDMIKLTNLKIGIDVEVVQPATGEAYINANRFNNVTIEGCVEMVKITSGITVPNEFTGNYFSGLQIQPSYATDKLFTVNGGYNFFSGMVWDLHLIPHSNNVIFMTATSEYNKFDMMNMPFTRVSDLGRGNDAGRKLVIENRTSDPADTIVGQMWFRTDLV